MLEVYIVVNFSLHMNGIVYTIDWFVTTSCLLLILNLFLLIELFESVKWFSKWCVMEVYIVVTVPCTIACNGRQITEVTLLRKCLASSPYRAKCGQYVYDFQIWVPKLKTSHNALWQGSILTQRQHIWMSDIPTFCFVIWSQFFSVKLRADCISIIYKTSSL